VNQILASLESIARSVSRTSGHPSLGVAIFLRRAPFRLPLALVAILSAARAEAVLDIDDRGPSLNAGNFAMRITNAGIVGNAFLDVGLSSDPSFQFPANSGMECLNYAALWVGAIDATGRTHVSGGPLLEWRPTLAADDRVRGVRRGDPGTRRLVDDDNDGRIDEEILNGKDDDGDGEIDEDLGFSADQMLAADYVDDRPEAVNTVSPGGESHEPLGLSVHQEAYAWSTPSYDGIAGLQFHITNHGNTTLERVYVGLLADLDSRARNDRVGHVNDRIEQRTVTRSISGGTSVITAVGKPCVFHCITRLEREVPVVRDGVPGSGLPVVAVLPLDHTTDPLALTTGPAPAVTRAWARAPGQVSFRTSVFLNGRPSTQGGTPIVDADRYAALAGQWPSAPDDLEGDWVALVSCGPFVTLQPGQSIDFAVALIAAEDDDHLMAALSNALFLYRGTTANLLPDSVGFEQEQWQSGATGIFGHEVCLEPPPGRTFIGDPHCAGKFPPDSCNQPLPQNVVYTSRHCVWTDADCDPCTGAYGNETVLHWLDPGAVPPPPSLRVTPGDHEVKVEWDNLPEVLINAGQVGPRGSQFLGYRLYKLADWRSRAALLPPRNNWALVAAYGSDSLNAERPLASVEDTSLDYEDIRYEQKHYPVGRYAVTDREVLNGFDYLYVVTTVYQFNTRNPEGRQISQRLESPLVTTFDRTVVPHARSRAGASGVWVVPNPFRAHADWDRPPVIGDQLTRHIDFMGLPRARCTIKIWTLAGDFVAQIDHDGSGGNGEAPWDLVTRNGQEAESGVYLFTVDSPVGRTVGRFVVIR